MMAERHVGSAPFRRRLARLGAAALLLASCVSPGIAAPPAPAEEAGRRSVRVLIVYYSRTGHTRAMAEAVAEGARSVAGTRVRLATVAEATVDDVLAADAVVVGSPVYNANVAPEVQSFINAWPFEGAPLRDKVGAAFVSAGGISAGEEATQLALIRSLLVFGMIVVGGPDWTGAFGASAVTEEPPFGSAAAAGVGERFLDKARALGRRVAEVTMRLAGAGEDADAIESGASTVHGAEAKPA